MADDQDKEADKRRDDPPEEVVGRMTAALKRALHTPPKPRKNDRKQGPTLEAPKARREREPG